MKPHERKSRDEFIRECGDRYERALTAALIFIKADSRFIGLDKVRVPLAQTAALNALGGNFKCALLAQKNVAGTTIAIELAELLAQTIEHVKAEL